MARIAAGWVRDLTFGGALDNSSSTHLLDTAPLRRLIDERVDFARLRENLRSGHLFAAGFSATNYATGASVTFYDAAQRCDWVRSNRISEYTAIGVDHIMASAAIPFLFPPVPVGISHFGDGALRMRAPLSAAIHLGAERLVAISVRRLRTKNELVHDNQQPLAQVTTATIAGVLLNAIFLDALDGDLERMARINRTLKATRPRRGRLPDALRVIPALVIHPSVDLGKAAQQRWTSIPRRIRYLLRGIGANEHTGSELLSYLAFHSDYTRYLVERGYADAMQRADDIVAFLSASVPVGDEPT
jgi:NTE family protein